jgi:hypothetical protein
MLIGKSKFMSIPSNLFFIASLPYVSCNSNVHMDVAIVEDIVGIASIKVMFEGKEEIIRISGMADEGSLRQWQTTPKTAVSETEVARFLENRLLIMNFLRCLMPPGTSVELYKVRRTPQGVIHAKVGFPLDGGKDGPRADLAAVVFTNGYGLPESHLWRKWKEGVFEDSDACIDLPIELWEVHASRVSKQGIWADRDSPPGVVRSVPLQGHVEPKLAVPFRAIHGRTSRGRQVAYYVGVTIVSESPADVEKIALHAARIHQELGAFLAELDGNVLLEKGFVSRVELQMLSRLRERQWPGIQPRLSGVQIRYLRLRALDPTHDIENGIQNKQKEAAQLTPSKNGRSGGGPATSMRCSELLY